MACTSVLFLFTLFYGYLQELVSIHIFAREFGLFVTFLQFCGYAFFAFLQWISREHKRNNVPMQYCSSVLQSSMQGLSNLSMRYLNYPAKVLFKSSRVLPTMLFGVIFYGESYCALHLPLSVSSLQPRHWKRAFVLCTGKKHTFCHCGFCSCSWPCDLYGRRY